MSKQLSVAILSLLLATCSKHSPYHHPVEFLPEVKIEVTLEQAPDPYERIAKLTQLFQAIRTEEAEQLPFDEPLHEYGFQLDGKLRPLWVSAYNKGKPTYDFNGDRYFTMNRGAPWVPQVCADFIVDTIDRTAGTWYRASAKHPHRDVGRFDMRRNMESMNLDPRRVPDLVSFMQANQKWFQFVYASAKDDDGPQVGKVKQLKSFLKDHDAQLGDLILIYGRAPWDYGREMHHHSFFVTGLGLDGTVSHVTGNPAYAVERTLAAEVLRAPRRHVTHIIRFTDEFLDLINAKKEKTDASTKICCQTSSL